MAPKIAKQVLSYKEDLNELVQSRGWNEWLNELVLPELKAIRRKLLQDEKLELPDRIALQKVLKLVEKFIGLAYSGGQQEETISVMETKNV